MVLSPEVARGQILDARIYLLLTRGLCRLDPIVVLDEALAAGADMVQVREPQGGDRELLEWVHDVRERCAQHRVPLIVNDRADIAILAGADGVHLGQSDLPPRVVRELVGPDLIVGLSTHDLVEVTKAASEPIDYIGIGPVFDTETKELEGRGADWLEQLLPHAHHPGFGIGGIGPNNVAHAVAAGLHRIAVSSAICGADEPGSVVTALRAALQVTGEA